MSDPEKGGLEERLVNWLDQEGLTHRRIEVPGSRFNLEVRHPTGLLYNVAQRTHPSDAVTVTGSIVFPDKFQRTLEKALRAKRLTFLQDLRFDLLTAGHTFQFLPADGTPKQVVILGQVWEDGLTKDSFMRLMQHVVNGLILVVWSFEEGMGYLVTPRRPRRSRTTK